MIIPHSRPPVNRSPAKRRKKSPPVGEGFANAVRLFRKALDGLLVDVDEQAHALDGDVLVGLMGERGIAGELGPEADAVFQGAGIRAAADRDGLCLLSRAFLVDFGERFHECAVLRVIERRLEVDGLVEQAHLVDGRDDLLVRDARGIADIDDDLKLALAEFDDVGRHREPARLVLELGEPVLVAEQAVDDVIDIGDVLEVFEEGQHGVFAELGRGAVCALADADELLALDLEAEALRLGDLDAAGQHFAVAADHVGSAPALHIEEGRAVKHEVETELQDALFRIDDGEVRIGREARLGHVRDFVVVLDAAPAALFVAADDELDLLARDEALILERLQGIECADRRALVVRRTAAPDLAVGDLAAEGIVRPALPRGTTSRWQRMANSSPSPKMTSPT